jgi:hypothetical protein
MSDAHRNFEPDDDPTMALAARDATSAPGRRRWSRRTQAAALLGVAAVVGGGAFAVTAAAAGSAAPAGAAATQTVTSPGSTPAQAAALRSGLSATGARRLARLRLLRGRYGQYTFQAKKGSRTLAYERGTITSVSGGDLVVRAANGTTWTWALTGTSVVREHGAKESAGTLAAGQSVLTAGPVTSGTRDARVVVIRGTGTSAKSSATD